MYSVNIELPNEVVFPGLLVTLGDFLGGDVLIGMDIIGAGDFAVTNQNGITKFSYRYPSSADIDFVREDRDRDDRLKRIQENPDHGSVF